MHQMLRIYYSQKKEGKEFATCKDEALKWGRLAAAQLSALDGEATEEVFYQFEEYSKFYRYETWEPTNVEQPFSKVLFDSEDLMILYEGIVDLTVKIPNVPILPVDHKTQSRKQDPEALNNQFMGYCWALDCFSFVVNQIGFQKTLEPKDRFRRPTLSYTRDQLAEWVENTIYWTHILMGYIDHNYWPKNFTSCDKFYGCAFTKICGADPLGRERRLLQFFKEGEPWKPTKELV